MFLLWLHTKASGEKPPVQEFGNNAVQVTLLPRLHKKEELNQDVAWYSRWKLKYLLGHTSLF